MSLSQSLYSNIEQTIMKYIDAVSKEYGFDKKELVQLWSGEKLTRSKETKLEKSKLDNSKLETINDTDLSPERLNKSTVKELQGLCKSKNLKVGGTKTVLISRLLGKEENSVKTETKTKEKTKKTNTEIKSSVLEKLINNNTTAITVRKNKYRNLEHLETKLIFDPTAKRVIGRQKSDGTIAELIEDDIENCKKYKFDYKLPENLDQKTNLEQVKVQELEDELENYENKKELEEDHDETDEEYGEDEDVDIEEELDEVDN